MINTETNWNVNNKSVHLSVCDHIKISDFIKIVLKL